MLEAIDNAKSQTERTQRVREFLPFIQKTRNSITRLISSMEHLDENNYGVSIPTTIEGFFLEDIDAARDLHILDAAGYSMTVFIGRQKVGKFDAWYMKQFHMEPNMVVDVSVNHTPSRTLVTNQVFVIRRNTIELWDRIHTDYFEVLPPRLSQDTRLITDVLDYAVKHPGSLRGRK